MKETEVSVFSVKDIAKMNNDILVKLVYISFKIIKSEKISKFYKSALNGLLKYIHLINIDLVQSSVDALYDSYRRLRSK